MHTITLLRIQISFCRDRYRSSVRARSCSPGHGGPRSNSNRPAAGSRPNRIELVLRRCVKVCSGKSLGQQEQGKSGFEFWIPNHSNLFLPDRTFLALVPDPLAIRSDIRIRSESELFGYPTAIRSELIRIGSAASIRAASDSDRIPWRPACRSRLPWPATVAAAQ